MSDRFRMSDSAPAYALLIVVAAIAVLVLWEPQWRIGCYRRGARSEDRPIELANAFKPVQERRCNFAGLLPRLFRHYAAPLLSAVIALATCRMSAWPKSSSSPSLSLQVAYSGNVQPHSPSSSAT